MNLSFSALSNAPSATKSSKLVSDDVVELGLLISTARAEELVALARRRGSSVGHLLRGLIDNALASESFS